jgi:MFS family permease
VTPWLGVLWAVVIVPVAVLMVKSSPQARGLQPDGDAAPAVAPAIAPELEGHTFRQARTTRFFVLMTVAYAFVMLSQVGALAHQNKLGSDRVSNGVGALAVSFTAGASVCGRLAGGLIVLRLPSRWLTAALIAVQGVALALMAHAETKASILFASVLLGLAVGNLLMLQPLLIAEAFGVREYGRVYSFSTLVTTVGVAGGPILLGFLEDVRDYQAAYMVASVSCVLALALFIAGGRVSQSAPVQEPLEILRPAVVPLA